MYTAEHLASLTAAIATGASRVKFGDKETEFRSLAEMKELKADMERQLGVAKQAPRVTIPTFDKGL